MAPITKPLKLKSLKVNKDIAKEQVAEKTETETERQLRLAKKLKVGNSYEKKLKAFNERLAKTTDFNDVPKMKG
jgi:hypothetical protein